MSAEGMSFAGWNTFSVFEADGVTVAQVQLLMRADDPVFELAMMVFAHRMEDRHWQHTLHNLAAHFGVRAAVEYQTVRLDRRRQCSRAGNLWYNAAVRSALHTLAAQLRPQRPTSTPIRHGSRPRRSAIDRVRTAQVCGWGTSGAWTGGLQRSTTDRCGLMEFPVDLARPHGISPGQQPALDFTRQRPQVVTLLTSLWPPRPAPTLGLH
jgi:hypothetical protein